MDEITQAAKVSNPKLDSYMDGLLMTFSSLEIDFDFAIQAFATHMRDMQRALMGIPYEKLGFERRLQRTEASIFEPMDASKYNVVTGGVSAEKDTKPGSIAHLKISGVMQVEDDLCSYGVDTFVNDMRAAYDNDHISAVLVETRSGGGASMAGDMGRSVIEERNKPVLQFIHLAGSAAYNMASVSDELIGSSNSASAGSIGTYVNLDRKLIEQYKDRFLDIYSDASPGKNKEWRAALTGDFSLMKAMVNRMTGEFHEKIQSARALTGDRLQIRETLEGDMFGALEAKQRGLLDSIGSMPFALERATMWAKKYKKKM